MYGKWTGNCPAKYFKENIQKFKDEKVQPDVSRLLKDIYGGQMRNDFHHLNKTVPTEYEELRKIATNKIDLLNQVESKVFEYEMTGKGMKYKYPQYWENTISSGNIFLRLRH